MSSAKFCELLQVRSAALPSERMAVERPIFHKEIGEEIQKSRKAKGWSLNRAVLIARNKGHKKTSAQALRWLEEGRTRYPEADILKAIADVFEMDYAVLALRITKANYERDLAAYGRDLLRHSHEEGSESHKGGSVNVPALPVERALVSELNATREQFSALQARFREVQAITNQLFGVAVRSKEGRAVARAEAGRDGTTGRTHR